MREGVAIVGIRRLTTGRVLALVLLAMLVVGLAAESLRGTRGARSQPPLATGASFPTARLASGDSVVLWRAHPSPRVPEALPAAASAPLPRLPRAAPLPPTPPRPYPYGWFGAETRQHGEWRPDVYDRYQRQLWK